MVLSLRLTWLSGTAFLRALPVLRLSYYHVLASEILSGSCISNARPRLRRMRGKFKLAFPHGLRHHLLLSCPHGLSLSYPTRWYFSGVSSRPLYSWLALAVFGTLGSPGWSKCVLHGADSDGRSCPAEQIGAPKCPQIVHFRTIGPGIVGNLGDLYGSRCGVLHTPHPCSVSYNRLQLALADWYLLVASCHLAKTVVGH